MINIDRKNTKIESGVWANFEGSGFLISYASDLGFQRAVQRLRQPYLKKIERGTLDPKVSRDIMAKAMAESLIHDWRDVTDEKGAKVVFSEDDCYKALVNNEELRDFLSEFAANLDNYRDDETQAIAKS